MTKSIAIVDYGASNLGSIINALNFLRVRFGVATNPKELELYDAMILPGVRAFGPAMRNLIEKDFVGKLEDEVLIKKKDILGICLGFQLLCNKSSEGGLFNGLNFINADVSRFSENELVQRKKTHIGFNSVLVENQEGMFLAW